MKVTTGGASAYVEKDFTGADEVFVQFEMYMPAASYAAVLAGDQFFGDILDFHSNTISGGTFLDGIAFDLSGYGWFYAVSPYPQVPGATTMPTDSWFPVELHYWKSHAGYPQVRINGVDYGANSGVNFGVQTKAIALGQVGPPTQTVDFYIRNVKVGTTAFGSTEILTDDFSTGDLSLWSSATGTVSVIDDPTVPPAAPAPTSDAYGFWTVDHFQHEYVPDADPSSTLVADGSLIQTVRPENLHFVMQLGQLGPGTIEYELSIDAVEDDGVTPVVSPDFVGPKRTDWLLKRSDLDEPLMGGVHTNVTGLDGETPIEAVQIAGKDWLHYLEGRKWPYDATLSYVNWPDGFRFKVAAGEVGQIVKDILETIRDLSANYPSAPDVLGPNPSYSLGFTVDADSTGVNINYEISNFDATSIYSLIQTLSLMGLTRGGFDFYMTWDKTFKLVAPQIGDPDNPIFSLEVDATELVANMLSIGFTNTGPDATHVLGVGAGTSNQQGGINKHFPASSAVFRRWDNVADFGDVKNLDVLERLTSLDLAFGSNPVHEIPVEVDTADIPNFWAVTRPGEYVTVVYDLGFHQINSTQRIVSMDCRVDTEGVETVQLSFNQFYDASDASGITDW